MKLFVALCCLAAVYAQVPKPCESPKQWEGSVLRVERRSDGRIDIRAKISYDEINQRVREVEEFEFGKVKEIYDVLYLHALRKEYRLNIVTRQCNVSALTRLFRPYGIPPGAQFDGFATIGAAGIAGEFINVENWRFSDGQERFDGAVSYPDCVPIQYNHFMPPASFITSSYFNIKSGIKDMSVFVPPKECTGE